MLVTLSIGVTVIAECGWRSVIPGGCKAYWATGTRAHSELEQVRSVNDHL